MRSCPVCHFSEQHGPFLIGLLNGEAAAMQDNKDENKQMQDNNGRQAGAPANGAADHGDAPAVEKSTWVTRRGLAQMLKGGVIMDVVTPEHARIAEDAGAVAVMALERVPADIRAHGGVARMSDPEMVLGIMEAVTIPVMAKCRIGHFVEAQILEAIGID